MKKNNKYKAANKISPLVAESTLVNILPDKINEIPQINSSDILKDAADFAYCRHQKAIPIPVYFYNDYVGTLTDEEHKIFKKYLTIYWSEENKRVYTCIHDAMKSTRAVMRMRFQLNELDKYCNLQSAGGQKFRSLYSAILNELMLYEVKYYSLEYQNSNETLYGQYIKLFNSLMEDSVRISEYLYNNIYCHSLQYRKWNTFYGYSEKSALYKNEIEVSKNYIRVADPKFAFHFLYTYCKKCKFDGPKISATYMQAVCVKIDDDKTLEDFYALENRLYAKRLILKIYTKQPEYNVELDLKDELANFKMNHNNLSTVLNNYEKYKADEKLYPKFIDAIANYIDNEVSFNKKREKIGEIYSEISERTDADVMNEINDRLSDKTRYYLLKYMCKN